MCAGFTVKAGKIDQCAPILRKRIKFFSTIAQPIPRK
jgi:hypothetical protein